MVTILFVSYLVYNGFEGDNNDNKSCKYKKNNGW